MGRKIAFGDLEPGMLTTVGLIVEAVAAGTKKIYGDKPYLKFYDIDDCYYGPCGRKADTLEWFEILHEEGTAEYKKVVQKMIRQNCERASDIESSLDWLRMCLLLKADTD
jgi:hypothetical protein